MLELLRADSSGAVRLIATGVRLLGRDTANPNPNPSPGPKPNPNPNPDPHPNPHPNPNPDPNPNPNPNPDPEQVRLFDRDTAKGVACPHRVCQNGLPLLLPHMSKQRATLPAATMRALLLQPEGLPSSGWSDGGEGAAQLLHCGVGSVALECDEVLDGRPLAVAVLYAPSGTLRPI